jgi:hypothetical protein
VLGRLNDRVSATLLETLHTCHKVVWFALIGMWITGIAMIYVRTGFELANFSPKLFTKIAVVSLLTINALMIGRFAMPHVEANLNQPLLDLPLRRKLAMSLIAGVSTTSWLLALALGVSKVLAASGWLLFVELVPLSYASAILVALTMVTLLHRKDTAMA